MVTREVVSTISLQVQLEEGNRYTRSFVTSDVGDGDTVTFYIENPSGSGQAILFDPPVQNAGGKILVTSYKNPTLDTQGTTLTTPNARFDQPENANANAFGSEATAISGGVELGETLAGIAQVGRVSAAPGDSESAAFLLLPGDSFGTEVLNDSNSTIDISSAVAFIEVPEDVVTENP
jgi:hypothetical protein